MWLDGAVPRVKINKGPEDWHHRDLALQSYKNWRSTDPRQRWEKKRFPNNLATAIFPTPPCPFENTGNEKIWSCCRAPAAGCLLNVLRADPAEKRKKGPQPREGVKRGGSLLEVLSR